MKSKHKHSTTYDGKLHTWYVHRLWELVKNLPVTEMNVSDLSIINRNCWFHSSIEPTVEAIGEHCSKALIADLSYPIILNIDGIVMDGAHRVLKCIIEKRKIIKVVKFTEMPKPDQISTIE